MPDVARFVHWDRREWYPGKRESVGYGLYRVLLHEAYSRTRRGEVSMETIMYRASEDTRVGVKPIGRFPSVHGNRRRCGCHVIVPATVVIPTDNINVGRD